MAEVEKNRICISGGYPFDEGFCETEMAKVFPLKSIRKGAISTPSSLAFDEYVVQEPHSFISLRVYSLSFDTGEGLLFHPAEIFSDVFGVASVEGPLRQPSTEDFQCATLAP